LGCPNIRQPLNFGRFKVVPHRRELLADGRSVELGARAFDTLVALIDARGTVLTKDELMSRVWPDRVVEENNVQAQISSLRKVFGADRDLIRTVAGRGYQFTGEIRAAAATAVAATPSPATNLSEPASELVVCLPKSRCREPPYRDRPSKAARSTGKEGVERRRHPECSHPASASRKETRTCLHRPHRNPSSVR